MKEDTEHLIYGIIGIILWCSLINYMGNNHKKEWVNTGVHKMELR